METSGKTEVSGFSSGNLRANQLDHVGASLIVTPGKARSWAQGMRGPTREMQVLSAQDVSEAPQGMAVSAAGGGFVLSPDPRDLPHAHPKLAGHSWTSRLAVPAARSEWVRQRLKQPRPTCGRAFTAPATPVLCPEAETRPGAPTC